MKYILMMNTMRAGAGVPLWPKTDLQAHIAFMHALNRDLRESGELVSAEGLSFPNQARLVRAGTRMALRSPTESFRSRKSFLPDSGSSMWTLPSGPMQLRLKLRRRPDREGTPLTCQLRCVRS